MPTAAKLVAALAFAAIGYALFVTMVEIYGDATVPRYLFVVCVGAGLIVGWHICGKNAFSLMSGIGNGCTAVVVQAIIIVFTLAFITMLTRSLRGRYDGPMDAVTAHFALMFEYTVQFASAQIGLIMLVGGIAGGALAGLAGKRFPR